MSSLVLLDIDPSIVRPGWIALAVTVFIATALVLLFISLRRQMRKISPDLPHSDNPGRRTPPPRPRAPDITHGQGSGHVTNPD